MSKETEPITPMAVRSNDELGDGLYNEEENEMIQPSQQFRDTRRERFEAWFEKQNYVGRTPPLEKNTAWVTWQDCEAACCNAFFDAGAVVPNA